jgi:hypothetical protein
MLLHDHPLRRAGLLGLLGLLTFALLTIALSTRARFVPAAEPTEKPPLGLNLASVTDWSSEVVFVDAWKAARAWIGQGWGKPYGQGGPLDLDALGQVRSLAPGQFAETVICTGFEKRFPAGVFTCLYEGDGELDFTGDARVVERQPGRLLVEIQPRAGEVFARLTRTNVKDPVRHIRLIMPGFEKTYAEQPFRPDFLKRWRGFRVFRFMDWAVTNNSRIVAWSDRPTPEMHSQALKGVALEYMIQLCNTLDVEPWFCMPHRCSDDYVRQFARLVKEKVKPALRIHLEYSNECWNTQFDQAHYCEEQGLKLGLNRNPYAALLHFYSQRSVEIFKLWKEVFDGKERLVRVLATQSANPWTGETVLGWREAWKEADAIAIAPYFGNRWGDPRTADQVAAMSPEELLEALREDVAESRKQTANYAALAHKRGLKLVAYEGGQHLVGRGGTENNDKLTRLFQGANRHPRMKALYLEDLKNWRDEGGGLFCVFSSMGLPSKWGSWGVLEHTAQDPLTVPKYQALQEFLEK